MSECLRVENLCKTYQGREIVKSLKFTIDQGQIFAFLGPNGAGKSTAMNMVNTLLEKTRGRIYIEGRDMDADRNSVKHKIGMVFQEDVLDSELTIYKNLLYRGGLYWKNDRELREQIDTISRLFSMEHILHQKYGESSGGQRRLAQIARAMLGNPRLLILDEPTTGLDPVTRKMVWNTLEKLRKQLHMTIFFSTHYLEEASYADTLCILKEGKILLCSSLDQIRSEWGRGMKNPELNEIYFRLLEEYNQ